MARGFPARRNLRHVDDRGHARFPRGLGEISGRPKDSWRDRIKEIGRSNAFHGCAYGVDMREIADSDLDAPPP